jgi:predicted amidohydrolase YtcJ
LQGRGVTPGFIDSHTHAESTAEFRRCRLERGWWVRARSDRRCHRRRPN